MFEAIQQLRAESLGHAAGDTEHGVALHFALDLAEPTNHPLLGVLANGAGVDEDDVRAVGLSNRFVT